MDNYEIKMKKIEDILADATQTELNHIHQFFAEAAKMEHDAEKKYTAGDVARIAWICLGGEYALRLPGAVAVRDGVPVEKAADALRMFSEWYSWKEITEKTGVTEDSVYIMLDFKDVVEADKEEDK